MGRCRSKAASTVTPGRLLSSGITRMHGFTLSLSLKDGSTPRVVHVYSVFLSRKDLCTLSFSLPLSLSLSRMVYSLSLKDGLLSLSLKDGLLSLSLSQGWLYFCL